MTITGSTNNNAWTYKLEVTETATSLTNRTSTIQIKAYIGRASSQGPIGGNYNISVVCDGQSQSQNGNIPWPTYINGGAWYELKTFTYTVSNTGNPTMINISSSMSSGDFTPSYASASGTMQLTILHLGPEITSVNLAELNTDVSDAGVLGYHIVQYLSIKKFTVNATYSDDATLSNLKVYHNNVLIGTSLTNEVTVDFANVGLLKTIQPGEYLMTNMVFELTDSLGSKTTTTYSYRVILYTLPTYENTSTLIKRKTGSGTVLTDNIGLLNFVGTCYLANDNIGNNNSVTVEYKIWDTDDTEPVNYTDITSSSAALGNDITITNYQISNLLFTDTYNYKIKISDSFGNSEEKIGLLPTGVAVWTEYKDRVDFLKLTVGGYNPFEYNENNEVIVGVYNDGINQKPIYRKVFTGTSSNQNTIYINLPNLSADIIVNAHGWVKSVYNNWWSISNYYVIDTNYSTSLFINGNRDLCVDLGSYFSYPEYIIILEYTKTTD